MILSLCRGLVSRLEVVDRLTLTIALTPTLTLIAQGVTRSQTPQTSVDTSENRCLVFLSGLVRASRVRGRVRVTRR